MRFKVGRRGFGYSLRPWQSCVSALQPWSCFRRSHTERSESTTSTVSWIEEFLDSRILESQTNGSNSERHLKSKPKRPVVGQVAISLGYCRLNTEPGLPEVPVEWLKNEMADAGPSEAPPANHHWLRGSRRRAQGGRGYKLLRHGWFGECRSISAVSGLTEWAARCRDARCWPCRPNLTGAESILLRSVQSCRVGLVIME
jgi:hypothetical protein